MKSITKGQIKAGIDAVRRTKLRNFWTMLGIIIGVASVITIVAISEGVKQQISGHINQPSSDVITVQPSTIKVNGSSFNTLSLLTGLSVSGSLSNTDISRVANTNGVAQVAPLSAMTAKVKGNQSSYGSGLVIGTYPDFPNIINNTMQYGSFLTSFDTQSNGVVLGNQAAMDLFNENVPLGQQLTINGQIYTVRGILNSFPSTPLSSSSAFNKAVFISYANSEALTNNTITTYEILAKPKNPAQTSEVTKNIYNNILSSHNGQANFTVLDQAQNIANTSEVLNLVTRLIIIVAGISLLVGGIGIMNVMLVSVTERMHEIGIRKAVGATNRQILNQFLFESITLSAFGGIIGIIFAVVIDVALRLTTNLQPLINVQVIVIAFLVAVVIGIVFGSVPAVKAAKKDPIEALRAE
ncbi:MAG: ABC transporter permease [Candidatus Saccharimonadales bacterium]